MKIMMWTKHCQNNVVFVRESMPGIERHAGHHADSVSQVAQKEAFGASELPITSHVLLLKPPFLTFCQTHEI